MFHRFFVDFLQKTAQNGHLGACQVAFERALASKIYPGHCGSVLDLHDLSEGAARAAIARWLPLWPGAVAFRWIFHGFSLVFIHFQGRFGGFRWMRNHWEGRNAMGLELVVGAGQLRKPWARGRALRLAAMAELRQRGVGFTELRRAVFGRFAPVLGRFLHVFRCFQSLFGRFVDGKSGVRHGGPGTTGACV